MVNVVANEELCQPSNFILHRRPTIGGYYMDLTEDFPQIRHTIRFALSLAPGMYSVTAPGTQDGITHMHVVGHMDKPHVNVQAFADIYNFEGSKTYDFSVEFATLLGPGVYNVRPEFEDIDIVMVIDWEWRNLVPLNHMP